MSGADGIPGIMAAVTDTRHPLTDVALASVTTDADTLYAAFADWVGGLEITPYPHQDEAIIEVLSGQHVVLATPTGSGKSLVATASHFAALAGDRVSFYTAPIKALVNEKFFALCEVFGADQVGLLTGDASVNSNAPIICCTAEVLANIALREGTDADVGLVVMDEFHYYADPQRGWAWQVPLLELPQAQFVLMSATLGDMSRIADDLTRRTGREVAQVTTAERPIPLTYAWSLEPLADTLGEIVSTHRAPVYVVHPSQAAAAEHARSLHTLQLLSKEEKAAVAERLAGVRFAAGFGRTLGGLLRRGIGVHHAGMLPRYRRIVEQLAQAGLLKVISGTDTLGVGINVPIRTVVLTGLTKFDGSRQRLLKVREFHQIAGRAGRAGFDTAGTVIVQAPDHVIENHRLVLKAGDDPKKQKRIQRKKAPEGFVNWGEETFDRVLAAAPEALVSRMQVTHSTLLNVITRPGDPVIAMRRLLTDNHEDPRKQAYLQRRAIEILRSLLLAGVVERLPEPDETGRTLRVVDELQRGFALNQPLSTFALAAIDLLDREDPDYAMDVVSIIEATLDDPRPVLLGQQFAARGEAVAQMKADGLEYEERMELLEDVTWPKPLSELLQGAFETYRQSHPWLREDDLSPKSVVRDLYERAMTFGEFVAFYQVTRAEGIVLRYLSDAYKALRQTVPDAAKTDELADVIEWLGEVVRQTDSSLLDEWEALTDPDRPLDEPLRPQAAAHRPITANERSFRVLIRRAMWRRVELVARGNADELARLHAACPVPALAADAMEAQDWEDAFDEYASDYGAGDDPQGADLFDLVGTGPDARGPAALRIDTTQARQTGRWLVEQILEDPDGDRDWRLYAEVDLAASDEEGDLVLVVVDMDRATIDHG